MLESLKKILKVYPLPIFVLLLTFVAYYSAFEFLKQKESTQAPISQEESMQSILSAETSQEIMQEIPKEAETPDSQMRIEEPLTIPQQLPETKPIVYLTSAVKSLNIRQDTNIQSAIVGKLTPAQMVLSLDEKDGWILLADSNTKEPIGWALKRFIAEVEAPQSIAETMQNLDSQMADLKATQSVESQNVESKIDSNLTNPKTPEIPQQTTLYASRVPSLNIREAPSTEAKILNKLTPNDAVSIVEENGSWVKIQDSNASGKNGWVVRRSLILRN